AKPALLEPEDRQDRVVHVAEARRARGHRVVQAARKVKDAIGLAAQYEIGREDRARRAESGGVPETGEHRVVARAQAEALGAQGRLAAVTRLEHPQIFVAVVHGERAFGRCLRRAHGGVEQARQPIRLHETPREAEALHPQRMMWTVVEARPRVGVDQRRILGYRRQCPDFPPSFSTSWTFAMVTPRSTAFTIS